MWSLPIDPTWREPVSDARLLGIGLGALIGSIAWMGLIARRHRRNLDRIPLRIHVAGTRGKSSTTRLIAAGLRAGGSRVVAKTTGSLPRLILPDGSEEIWPRRGPVSVSEQARFIARAVQLAADTVVVECMAIRKEMIWASERHLVRASTAVITNTRADHFEDVGEDPDAMADALRWAVPDRGRLIMAKEAANPGMIAWAAARNTSVVEVDTANLAPAQANRTLALAVCEAHGVPAAIAGPAMDMAVLDPDSFFERTLSIEGKTVRFANAFACNDVESFSRLWPTLDRGAGAPVVLLNARRDRPLRTRRFLEFLSVQAPLPILFVAGDLRALRLARRAGFASGAVRALRERAPAAVLAKLAASALPGGLIWGVGNYRGLGARLIGEMRERRPPC
jgi:poly-gamma-glutamate synthase PgsB/CapB